MKNKTRTRPLAGEKADAATQLLIDLTGVLIGALTATRLIWSAMWQAAGESDIDLSRIREVVLFAVDGTRDVIASASPEIMLDLVHELDVEKLKQLSRER